MQIYEIKDFTGGMNTQDTEPVLPYSMTASAINVDVLESGGFRNRRGYAVHASMAVAATIHALHRYYRKAGGTYWMVVAGTALYVQADPGVSVGESANYFSPTTYEAETIASYASTWAGWSYSNGVAAYCQNGTAVFVTPRKVTSIKARLWGAANCASLKVTDGASYDSGWLSVGGSKTGWSYENGGLTATHYHIQVKPAPNNAAAFKGAHAPLDTSHSLYAIHRTFNYTTDADGNITPAYLRLDVWPDATVGGYCRVYVSENSSISLDIKHYYGQGYTTLVPGAWNELRMDLSDGVADFVGPSASGQLKLVVAYDPYETGTRASLTTYVDRYIEDDVLVDDCGNLSTPGGWDSNGLALSVDGASGNTTRLAVIDCFQLAYPGISLSGATKVYGTLSASSTAFSFSTLNDVAYVSSYYDGIVKYNGTVASRVAGGSPGEFICDLKRRLFKFGKIGDPELLEASDVDEPQDWTGGWSGYPSGKDTGGRATGLVAWDNRIWALTHNRIAYLDPTGSETAWVIRAVSQNIGCDSGKTLKALPNGIIWLSSDGVRAYGVIPQIASPDGSGVLWMSRNINDDIVAEWNTHKSACAGVYHNRYWLAFPSRNVWVCDLDKRIGNQPVWTKYTYPFTISCFFTPRADEDALYAGCTDGKIRKLDYGATDAGSKIGWVWRVPPVAPAAKSKGKNFQTIKHFRTVIVGAETTATQRMSILAHSDQNQLLLSQQPPVTGSSILVPHRKQMSIRGQYVGLRLSGSSTAADGITISSLGLRYVESPPR